MAKARDEDSLHDSEEVCGRLVEVFSDAPVGLCCFDTQLRFVYINKWLAKINGLTVKEHLGRTVGEVLPDVAPGIEPQLLQVIETGKPILQGTVSGATPSHPLAMRHFQHNYRAIKSNDGTVVGVSCAVLEITKRIHAEQRLNQAHQELERRIEERTEKLANTNSQLRQSIEQREHAEARLRASESEFRLIANSVPALFSYVGADGCYRFVNRRYQEWFGTSAEEIVGKHYRQVLGEPVDEIIRQRVEAALSGERVEYEAELPYRHGATRWVNAIYVPDKVDGEVRGFFALVTDITRLKNVEDALLQAHVELEARVRTRTLELDRTNERLRNEIERHERTGEALRAQGEQLRSILASTADGIIAIDSAGIIGLVNDSALRMFGYENSELLGQNVNILMPEPYRSEHDANIHRYLRTGEAKIIGIVRENMCRRKDGTRFPADLTVTETSINGNQHIFIGTVRDISERKEAETKLLQRERELTHVARLGTMGEMATGLAHELNQPLGAISNYAGNCLHLLEAGDTPGLRADLAEIVRITKRCGEIIQRIRRFVKRREPSHATVDVVKSIAEVLAFVRRDARLGGIDVHFEPPEAPVFVFADSIQIEQVLLNLARNAIEAMAESEQEEKVLSIEVENRHNEVEIRLRDTGDGIPSALIERVCDPFVSTKSEGLGMGLSICQTVVEAHRGTLEIVSEPGCGTLVRVTFSNLSEAFDEF